MGAGLVTWSPVVFEKTRSSPTARHWNLAWCGLDLSEAGAASATAWLLARGDRRAARSATVLATLLCADAWFDVCTAPAGRGLRVAIAEAALLELPLAAGSIWLSARLSADP